MNGSILSRAWTSVRASYWFIPSLMSLAAVGLSYLMPYLDGLIEGQGGDVPGWIYGGGVQGARSLLSTIAGSMITVASLTFSITLVALSAAAQQYGPRLLSHFMSDSGYQFTLGTFVSTFVYCVLVLRQVQDVEGRLVLPRLAVSFAVLLALAALAMLIYFIHHAAASLRPDDLVRRIGNDLRVAVDKAGKKDRQRRAAESPAAGNGEGEARRSRHPATVLRSPETGYLQTIDEPRLKTLAADGDLVIRSLRRPGDFVLQGSGLVEVGWPQGPELETGDKVLEAFGFGSNSFPKSDVEVAIGQLVEVAVRAESPSLNNPTTAIAVIDELEQALGQLVRNEAEAGRGASATGEEEAPARFETPQPTLAHLVGLSFDLIRHHGRGMPSVNLRLMRALVALSGQVQDRYSMEAVLEQAELTARAGQDLPEAKDRRSIARLYSELAAAAEKRGSPPVTWLP